MLSRTTNILLALALALALGSTWRLDDDPEGLQIVADEDASLTAIHAAARGPR